MPGVQSAGSVVNMLPSPTSLCTLLDCSLYACLSWFHLQKLPVHAGLDA